MDGLTRAQIIWTETKDLRVPDGGDPSTLTGLRQAIGAIANDAGRTFARFEAIPARDDALYGPAVMDCASAAEASSPGEFSDRGVILWPSADGKTLSKTDVPLPAPWDSVAPDALALIGRFTVDGHDVSAFSRTVGEREDASRFVSLVTGTGLPPDVNVYIPRERPRRKVSARTVRAAFICAAAAVALFAAACLWSLSVGNLTRLAQSVFASSVDAQACSTMIDPATTSTLYGAPRAWLPTLKGYGPCMTAWQTATASALHAPGQDWWSSLKAVLASWTMSSSGFSFSLRMPILLMMASIILLAGAAGGGIMGRPFGLFIDKRNRMSLTRLQFAVWLVILMGPLAAYALFNVGFWAEDLNRINEGLAYVTQAASNDQKLTGWADKLSGLLEYLPRMDLALWGLIGISGVTSIASSLIMQQPQPAPGVAGSAPTAQRTRILSNAHPMEAELTDLVYGETAEDDGVVDSTRVQAVVVTGVLAAIYVNLALEASERVGGLTSTEAVSTATQVFASMPPAGGTFLWLLGLSHGTLIGGKLLGAYRG